jgi:hypothetical protein
LNTSESVFPVSVRLDLAVVGKSDFLLGPKYDEASVSIDKFRSFDDDGSEGPPGDRSIYRELGRHS